MTGPNEHVPRADEPTSQHPHDTHDDMTPATEEEKEEEETDSTSTGGGAADPVEPPDA